ncbi:MAG TPA: Glu/Leu/Phe/Val dehydrogenase dimerization domain-containing protein [Thermoanaerobaculia bacterium]|jgi:leucine dehydrogenase|nr:Glu/Leu/Phe/Val dehydrogenase dimerization domain-containing protein [Thermoanaerobaculia bacterium]
MELFQQMAEMGHERVLFCSSPEVGLKAIIAVHSTILGPGLGGVRMWPYSSTEEALTDVLRLSRGMTYKAAAAGLNLGGGKAVILGDPKKDKSEALFRAFGRFVESLNGLYITAEDVGSNMDDMEAILSETRWVTGVSPSSGGSGDPSSVTAFGVLQGMKAAVEHLFGGTEGGATLAGRSVAIQGLGNVGYHLSSYLKKEKAGKIFAADIDPERCARVREEFGVEIVPVEEILAVNCDVVAPCALGAVLNERTIPTMRCRIVAGAANNQLADEERDGQALHERGILYAPDFVGNAGGLINVYNELTGYNRDRAMQMARGIHANMARVFQISRAEAIPTYRAADRVAEERIRRIQGMRAQHWTRAIRQTRNHI